MKPWRKVKESEIGKIKRNDCWYCKYSSASATSKGATLCAGIVCIYILYESHRRPCRPGECRETGVFVPKSTKRRRPYLK